MFDIMFDKKECCCKKGHIFAGLFLEQLEKVYAEVTKPFILGGFHIGSTGTIEQFCTQCNALIKRELPLYEGKLPMYLIPKLALEVIDLRNKVEGLKSEKDALFKEIACLREQALKKRKK